MDILTISPPFLPAPVSSQFLCSAVTRALLIVLQCLPVQHCCPLIGAPWCCSLEAISQSANFTFLWGMCFMEENHWLLPHKMWQLCYIPNQHHHLLHQCCAAQCAEILRAGIKCCQSNLDQAQFSGLSISCKYLLLSENLKVQILGCSNFCFAKLHVLLGNWGGETHKGMWMTAPDMVGELARVPLLPWTQVLYTLSC